MTRRPTLIEIAGSLAVAALAWTVGTLIDRSQTGRTQP